MCAVPARPFLLFFNFICIIFVFFNKNIEKEKYPEPLSTMKSFSVLYDCLQTPPDSMFHTAVSCLPLNLITLPPKLIVNCECIIATVICKDITNAGCQLN